MQHACLVAGLVASMMVGTAVYAQSEPPIRGTQPVGGPNGSAFTQHCVYEPSTGRYEIRRTTNSTPPGEPPISPGVCDQHQEVPSVRRTEVDADRGQPVPTGTDADADLRPAGDLPPVLDAQPPVVTTEEPAEVGPAPLPTPLPEVIEVAPAEDVPGGDEVPTVPVQLP